MIKNENFSIIYHLSLFEATLNNLKSSKANNTLRAYKSDFKDFGAFLCKTWFKFFANRT